MQIDHLNWPSHIYQASLTSLQRGSNSGNTWKRLKVPRAKNEKWAIWKNVKRHWQLWPVKHEGEEWQDVYSCHLVPSLTAGRRPSDLSFPLRKPPFHKLTFIYLKLIFILDLPFLLCFHGPCGFSGYNQMSSWSYANHKVDSSWVSYSSLIHIHLHPCDHTRNQGTPLSFPLTGTVCSKVRV